MPFAAKYSDDQRQAVAQAYLDKRIRPARRVTELAAAGELRIDGRVVPAFDIAPQSVRQMSSTIRRQRAGTLRSGLTDVPHADAVESLRRRLIAAADHMLRDVERRQRRKEPANPDLLRQIARAAREAASIPTYGEPRPVAPGQKLPGGGGKHNGGQTQAGIAGAILQAHRRVDGRPATGGVYTGEAAAENADIGAADEERSGQSSGQSSGEAENGPGAWVTAQVSAMRSEEIAPMRDPTASRTPQP